MENGVAWIFKTLLKVPVIIMVSFGILNIFAFTVSYFRVVGAGNTLQQAVMDNNYLTAADEETFRNYLRSLETSYLTDIKFVIDTEVDNLSEAPKIDTIGYSNDRKQYGNAIDVGVVATYNFIMPLDYKDTVEGGQVAGFGGVQTTNGTGGVMNGQTIQDMRTDEERASKFGGRISVVNRVIGMQYYSDLD